MNGYDLGGAEYPIDPANYTVVDIAEPDDNDVEFLLRDLNRPGWSNGLKQREFVYIGKVLRYLKFGHHDNLIASEFADEVNRIVDIGGRIIMFDYMYVIEPIMTRLLSVETYEMFSCDLVNPPFDGQPAEYRIELMGR
jgi:hypothetical protein